MDIFLTFLTIVSIALIWAVIAAAMLSSYNKAGTGFLLGLFLGPIGLWIAWTMRDDRKKAEAQKRHDELIGHQRHQEQMQAMSALRSEQNVAKPMRECPYCAEDILAKATLCKHCGKEVEPIAV